MSEEFKVGEKVWIRDGRGGDTFAVIYSLDTLVDHCIVQFDCGIKSVQHKKCINKLVKEFDPVTKPRHYNIHPSGVQAIEITEHMNFCIGNAVKYLMRAGIKTEDPTEDLRKSVWYIEREIARLEKQLAVKHGVYT